MGAPIATRTTILGAKQGLVDKADVIVVVVSDSSVCGKVVPYHSWHPMDLEVKHSCMLDVCPSVLSLCSFLIYPKPIVVLICFAMMSSSRCLPIWNDF